MYIVNGIAYACAPMDEILVADAKPLDDMTMILTFANGEKRVYDATQLLKMPVFQPLADEAVFRAVRVAHGVVTWLDGEIDIAPETMYRDSFRYDTIA